MNKKLLLFIAGILLVVGISYRLLPQKISTSKDMSVTISPTAMKITSPAFKNNASLPKQYTCDGKGVNPPLHFEDVPALTKSLVVLMDDPDVPKSIKPDGIFDHWVLYNISPTIKDIPENIKTPAAVGKNSAGKNAYVGACPPDRQHRYFFRLYALDTQLMLDPQSATKQAVLTAMQGHILAEAELIGLYERHK